jgi:hypothetical protein
MGAKRELRLCATGRLCFLSESSIRLEKTPPLIINFIIITQWNWRKVMNDSVKSFHAAVDGFAAVKDQLAEIASKNGVPTEVAAQRIEDTEARLRGRQQLALSLLGN